MSDSFALDWLRLREPLDAAARAPALTRAFARRLPRAPHLVDLGAGTGSTLRHLAPRLDCPEQSWTLVDKDMALLTKAPGELTQWAEKQGWTVAEERRALRIQADEMTLRAEMRRYDLTTDLTGLALGQVDGVTCSALLDLVSADWIGKLAAELARSGYPPFLATLTVDGRTAFEPADPDDGFVMDRFHAHMRGNKGFGPALGPEAASALADTLRAAGYKVQVAPADWHLRSRHKETHRLMVDGYARSATGMDPAAGPRIEAWAARRRAAIADGATLMVGHQDLLAIR